MKGEKRGGKENSRGKEEKIKTTKHKNGTVYCVKYVSKDVLHEYFSTRPSTAFWATSCLAGRLKSWFGILPRSVRYFQI